MGNPSDCTAECVFTPITTCIHGDGCCPDGCDPTTDNDCSLTCGDGVVDAGEACDGNCPTSCHDTDECTTDTLVGSAANCSAQCSYAKITTCVSGDGCCPTICATAPDANDSDCPSSTCLEGIAGGYAGVTMSSQTIAFEVIFDVTPQTASVEAGVGLASGTSTGLTWSSLATIVRFNSGGFIDALNSALPYESLVSLAYTANTTYRVREVVGLHQGRGRPRADVGDRLRVSERASICDEPGPMGNQVRQRHVAGLPGVVDTHCRSAPMCGLDRH